MTPEEFRRHGHQAIDWIADFLADPERYPVLPPVKPGQLTDALPARGPEHGEPMQAILADFERLVVPAMTHWNHPGFLAYFANSSPPEGILGELYAAALNGNGMLWKTSPAVTELEQVALRWLRQWCGLPEDWFGLIYDTASTGSMHAIAAARQAADPESRTRGTAPGLVVYTSEQAHSSIEKGAIAVGIGQDFVRKVPVDDEFRMRPEALQSLIEADLAAGLRPCCVAATVGTTSTTSVDPVPAIAALCERHGLWLHVDAAYAGSAAVAPEFRWAFEGCDRADSFVTNPHKWLLTPMDCSIFYTRRPDVLRRAFSLIPEYLETAAGSARHQPDGLRRPPRPPLPRPQALVRATLLRPRRPGCHDPPPRRPGAGFRAARWMPTRCSNAPRLRHSPWFVSATRARTIRTAAFSRP